MGTILHRAAPVRIERSCGPSPGDWIRFAPPQPGIDRLEAFFSGHAYDPHRHDTYAVGYTVSGVQSFDYRGNRADSLPGDVIVLHPDETHDGRAGAETGFRYRMLYIEPRLVRDALGGRATSLPFVRDAVLRDRRLREMLGPAFDTLGRPLEPLERDEIILCVAEALLARDRSARGRAPAPACAIAVERVRSFLDAHFDRAVASGELEAVAGFDRYALARHFRSRLGTSPYRYLTMRRLNRVRNLIRAGQPLAEAAAAAGFADQSHMTRQFRRAYGLPPGRWRALARGT